MARSIGWQQKFFSRAALKKSAIIFGVLAGIYLLVASLLILWPRGELFVGAAAVPSEASRSNTASSGRTIVFRARDEVTLSGQLFGPAADTIVVFLHEVASDQRQLAYPAASLARRTGAQVLTLDLRGHGGSGGTPNDVDYIGQYTDDLEDIVRALRQENPTRKIIIAGHSMGGGIAMRYALKDDAPVPAGYLLFAPNLGEGPTEGNSEESAPEGQAPTFVHLICHV